MTPQQRSDIENGVWLCQTCAKLVDNDEVRFNGAVLRGWKGVAEQEAFDQVGKTAPRSEAVKIVDKWVNLAYSEKAGITQELTGQGYDLRWSTANEESERVDLQGWEPVLLDQADGTKARLKIHDNPVVGGYLVLLKKKKKP